MKHILNVNLSSHTDVLNTLNHLIDHYDEIAKDSYENSGLEFHDSTSNQLIKLDQDLHPEIPNYSELAFYLKVVEDPSHLEPVQKYTQKVIEKNSRKSVWMNQEIHMGLSAAFALAFKDKKYIPHFVDVLRTFDLNHEVYDPFFIELLLEKWGGSDEALYLLAARSGSISGQWGIENYEIPQLNSEQKNQFIAYLLKDSLSSKSVDSELLIDALDLLEISVDTEKFERLFKYYKPVFDQNNIPTIHHL